jgi:hypothetical protein
VTGMTFGEGEASTVMVSAFVVAFLSLRSVRPEPRGVFQNLPGFFYQ